MKSLYISRKVINQQDIFDWAKDVGFTSMLPLDDLHVTIVYCKDAVDWDSVDRDEPEMLLNLDPDDEREVHLFDGGACVLEIFCPELVERNSELAELGIKGKFSDYRSHITITYEKPDDLDITKVTPYHGPIILGPEIFRKIQTDWKSKSKEISVTGDDNPETLEETVDIDLDHAYDLFTAAYQGSTGTSWSKEKFEQRARYWDFYGDLSGYVAIREQASGMRKLVGVAGTMEGISKGLRELSNDDKPTWGLVSGNLSRAAKRYGYIAPHLFPGGAMAIRLMMKLIPASVFGGVPIKVENDGGVTLSYDDVGDAKKYLIGNRAYFSKMMREPTLVAKLREYPLIAHFMAKITGERIDEKGIPPQ